MILDERILAALHTRLSSITQANGYPLSVKSVEMESASISFNIPESECPRIEVIQDDEDYENKASGHLEVSATLYLRLIASGETTNSQMAQFRSAVIRCLYGNSYSGNSNAGITLADAQGNTLTSLRVVRCVKDINMVKSNRIHVLQIELRNNRQTWSF